MTTAWTSDTVLGAAAWAPYLVNGDASGLDDREVALADAWRERRAGGGDVVDCGEPFFSWLYGFHAGDDSCSGGDLVEYAIISTAKGD